MKDNRWLQTLFSALPGILFSFLFSVTSLGCLITGWDLPVRNPEKIAGWCIFFILTAAVMCCFRHGSFMLLGMSAGALIPLWKDGTVWPQLLDLMYTISSHFHEVYNWKVIGVQGTGEYDLLLMVIAYITAVSVSWCIGKRKHIVFALLPILLPLILCLITTDKLPDEKYLYLLMTGIALLLVTDWVRKNNPSQWFGLTMSLALPAAAALAGLFLLNPQEAYVNRAAELQKTAASRLEELKMTSESVINGGFSNAFTGAFTGQTLNLKNVGPKSRFSYTVMRVTSPYSGTVYLRGRDYDRYTGTVWESSEERKEEFPSAKEVTGTMSIVTYSVRNVLYVPYYTSETVTLTDGFLENAENTLSYRFSVSRIPEALDGVDTAYYTELPDGTAAWAKPLARTILSTGDGKTAVQKIRDYVSDSASYSLGTESMPEDKGDFAKWFLEESDTGYCVHFATAAAVLLRASGIPARYVEGYMIDCQADEKTLVSNQEAHAWVEYYDDSSDVWRILEATPASDDITENGDAEDTSDPAETEPEPDETEPEESKTADETEKETEKTPEEPDETSHAPNPDNGEENRNPPAGSGNVSGPPGIGGNPGTVSGEAPEPEPFRLPGWVKKALWVIPIIGAAVLQAELRIAWKRKRWNSGSANQTAIIRWRQSRRLARLMKQKLPDELENLAVKAVFSQHILTSEELERFDLYRQAVLRQIGQMPRYRRLLLRLIFAVG